MRSIVKIPKAFLVVFLLCFLIRLFFFLAVKPWIPQVVDQAIIQADAREYHQLAINLVEHREFASNGQQCAIRTPIYPLFVALHYAILGRHPWVVLLTQVFMSTASCVLLYLMARRFLSDQAALFACILFALDPFFILYSVFLFSDILFVFFCLVAAYFFSVAISKEFGGNTTVYVLISAVFFGLATLTKPLLQYIPFAIIGFLLICLKSGLNRAVKLSLVFAAGFLVTISPWLIRNAVTFGAFSLSTSGAYNLLILYVTPMEMERREQPYTIVEENLYQEAKELMKQEGLIPDQLHDFEKAKYWKRVALQYVAKYPFLFVKQYTLGIFRSFTNLVTRGYADLLQLRSTPFNIRANPNVFNLLKQWLNQKTKSEILLGVFIGLYLLISYICLILGLFIGWYNHGKVYLSFCLIMVLYFMLITGTAGLARFKMPAIPFYLNFAGIGLAFIVAKMKDKVLHQTADGSREEGNASPSHSRET